MKSILERILADAGVSVTESKLDAFEKYYMLLLNWNQKMNLTAITEKEEAAVKHFYDSLTLLKHLNGADGLKLIDIGSGAGFPGVPLKIMRQDLNLTLMDSLQKRIRFLCELKEALGLNNTECVHMRAEDGAHNPLYRQTYDVAVSRAVAGLDVLSAYALGFVKAGGRFLAMKGPEPEEEIKKAYRCIKEMGGEINSVETVVLPLCDIKRTIISIDKVRQCSEKNPKMLLKRIKSEEVRPKGRSKNQ